MTFFEKEMELLFGDSEFLSADAVFSDKTLIGGIGSFDDKLLAKIQFTSTKVADHYDALKLSIINKEQGVIDTETFRFVNIIGKKNGTDPYIWDYNGNVSWYNFKPTELDRVRISDMISDYCSMYESHDLCCGMAMGGM